MTWHNRDQVTFVLRRCWRFGFITGLAVGVGSCGLLFVAGLVFVW